MESAAPYDTKFAPEYRLKIIGGKQTYVPDYSKRYVDSIITNRFGVMKNRLQSLHQKLDAIRVSLDCQAKVVERFWDGNSHS